MSMSLVTIVSSVLNIYSIIIFIWAILSWFGRSQGFVRDIYNALDVVVAPYVNLFRRFIPPLGGLDLSPLIAMVVLQILARALVFLLR